MRRTSAVVAGLVVVALAAAGCSSAGTASSSSTAGLSASKAGLAGLPGPSANGRVAPAPGPVPVAAPLTGGNGIDLASAATLPPLPSSWVQDELSVTGTAVSYRAVGALGSNGRFHLAPGPSASYETRIVVRRPRSPSAFNGVVVVEWLNVSGGLDAAPEYTYLRNELVRAGYAWVGVSAQYIGIEGGPVAVSTPVSSLGGAGKGIVAEDPARYGKLHHPGDAFSYDIFTQVGRLLRHPRGVDPLGPLHPKVLLAAGESQSAIMLTTYIDGVQPLEHEYDGFLVHSRGGGAAPLGQAGKGINIAQTIGGPPVRIRTDLHAPVLMVETESDVAGLLDYLPASQPDTDRIRTWEVAGTSHVDVYQLGSVAKLFGCTTPVNAGPDHFVVEAALVQLTRWADGGPPPPHAPRFVTRNGKYVRSSLGIVEGGIRTPPVEVPTEVLSGHASPGGSIACLLAGSTTPIPTSTLARLYPSRAVYLRAYAKATDEAIASGFVLPQSRAAMLAMAQPDKVPVGPGPGGRAGEGPGGGRLRGRSTGQAACGPGGSG